MPTLTLYHGSRDGLFGAIRPDQSRRSCDFGQGFYMGVEVHQPRTLICGKQGARRTLYTLELDLTGLRCQEFPVSLDWALFVAFNRGLLADFKSTRFYARYADIRDVNDVLFGKIANDRIYDAVTGFFEGQWTAECLLEALQAVNLGDQYCAITPAACAAVRLIDEHVLSAPEIEKYAQQAACQREHARKRTDEIFLKSRHRDGVFFDEILQRLADENLESPADFVRGGAR